MVSCIEHQSAALIL